MRKKRNNTNKKNKKIHTKNNKKQKINNTHTDTQRKKKENNDISMDKDHTITKQSVVFLRKKHEMLPKYLSLNV